MINTKHLLKVASSWISIVYNICFMGVAIYPPIRGLLMKYSLHADVQLASNYFGIRYFITGLVIWNIAGILGFWLFAYLFNKIKK